ncbi:MAG: glycosyltransferase [Candidatus Peribacteraceae bacterium]|nr:glycosyltransferase [Candidatus Peribacteraceae bacterium]MDD5075249.1 glycosyltransferase [Candidatus Peribacteraceae bacterium]
MRILFISQARFPTEKAHGHQIAQVCAAMVRLGHDVTLTAPDVRNTVLPDPQAFYDIRESFPVERLPVFDALRAWWVPGFLAFAVTMRSYAAALRRFLPDHPADLLYTRSPRLLPVLLASGVPVALELHTLPYRRPAFVRRCNACRVVICLTQQMRDALVQWGVDPARVITEGDGVHPDRFCDLPSPQLARARWRLPSDRPVAGYVGSLVTRDNIEKGVALLPQAFALLKKRGHPVFGWIIGGPRDRIVLEKKRAQDLGLSADDLRFEGALSGSAVPSALAACSVCVYPAPASDHPFFRRDTSPLKVFEYLAAGRPTVCADIPPLRGVLDPSLVHFFTPGDPASLADAIAEALAHPKMNEERRRALIEHVSWDARMRRILAFARS